MSVLVEIIVGVRGGLSHQQLVVPEADLRAALGRRTTRPSTRCRRFRTADDPA